MLAWFCHFLRALFFVLLFLLPVGVVFIQCQAEVCALYIYNSLLLQILLYRGLNTMITAYLKGKPSFFFLSLRKWFNHLRKEVVQFSNSRVVSATFLARSV